MTSKQLYIRDGAGVPHWALDRMIRKVEYTTRDAGRLCEWPQLLRETTQWDGKDFPPLYEPHSKKDVKNAPVRIVCNTPINPAQIVAYVRFPGEDWYCIMSIDYEEATEAALSFLISSPVTDFVREA